MIKLTDWTQDAACKGMNPEMFMHTNKGLDHIARARNICESCPVKQQCLDRYMQYPEITEHIIAGGLTHRERLKLKREQTKERSNEFVRT